jgi:alanine racemase
MLVGVVGVGYGDGYPQFAQNGTPVLVNGVECALVGRVSMDMLTVDLRNQPHAKIGDPVVLWGEGLPVERVARASATSAYEILTRMTPRPKIEVSS